MRPIWLIEANVYGNEVGPLLEEIRRQGLEVGVVRYEALSKGAIPNVEGRPLSSDACVIGYGTFPFARQIQLHHPWRPGAWCNQQNLDCATYFAHFGQYLLNEHYAIMPGIEAIRQRDWLFSIMGDADEVFVRPTGCQKLFVGRRVSRNDFSSILSPTRYDPTTAVVVAPTREIRREWRLVVAGEHVISGSQYAEDGERAISPDLPFEVGDFAQSMLSKVRWRPDPMFMLDICESNGRLWLVELNSFSSSWLYACDLPTVVAAAGRLAEESWARALQ